MRARNHPGRLKADYRQSTFLGVPIAPAQLVKRRERYVPVLGEDGQIDRQILALMDGATPLDEIARTIENLFPAQFRSERDALTRVGELSTKYSLSSGERGLTADGRPKVP